MPGLHLFNRANGGDDVEVVNESIEGGNDIVNDQYLDPNTSYMDTELQSSISKIPPA